MAIVKKYQARIGSIKNEISGIYTLEIESLGKPFHYASGQFLHLAMDEEYDGSGQWPESRCFSMQSNPDEETIRITYATKGTFTKAMEENLKTGSKIWIKLPYGDLFQQPHDKANTVFIAGGTGLTPFLSLFSHSSFSTYKNPILYAGFRNQKMNLYEKELTRAQEINPGFLKHLVYEDKDGVLNINQIVEQSKPESTFFISGPPAMITVFKNYLLTKGVKPEAVLSDDWA